MHYPISALGPFPWSSSDGGGVQVIQSLRLFLWFFWWFECYVFCYVFPFVADRISSLLVLSFVSLSSIILYTHFGPTQSVPSTSFMGYALDGAMHTVVTVLW